MATEHKHVRELRKRLQREDIQITQVEYTGNNHLRLHLRKGPRTGYILHSLSPSSPRADDYAVRNARRVLK